MAQFALEYKNIEAQHCYDSKCRATVFYRDNAVSPWRVFNIYEADHFCVIEDAINESVSQNPTEFFGVDFGMWFEFRTQTIPDEISVFEAAEAASL